MLAPVYSTYGRVLEHNRRQIVDPIQTASFDRWTHHHCNLYTTHSGYHLGSPSTAVIMRWGAHLQPVSLRSSPPSCSQAAYMPRSPIDGISDSILPLCGSIFPGGVGPCVILSLLPSHADALYGAYQSILLPQFPLMPLVKIASLRIVEDGLRDPALGVSLTPLCRPPLDSGARLAAESHHHLEQFVPFAGSSSSASISSGKFTRCPDPPFEYRTKFEAWSLDDYMHTKTIEFPLAGGVVWSKPNVQVPEDPGLCSFAAFSKEEYAMFNQLFVSLLIGLVAWIARSSFGHIGTSSSVTSYSASTQTALELGFTVDSFLQSSILNGNRVWICTWLLCPHRPFSRKDRAVAHVARVHIGTKMYSCRNACGNPRW